jgi:hypothetical protein
MIVDPPELTHRLPPDILYGVVDLLQLQEIKDMSCASTRMREACLPSLFRRVKFEFSEAGLRELRGILNRCSLSCSLLYVRTTRLICTW